MQSKQNPWIIGIAFHIIYRLMDYIYAGAAQMRNCPSGAKVLYTNIHKHAIINIKYIASRKARQTKEESCSTTQMP